MLYEWARNPYVLLCVIYVLSPYIATVVVDDPVRGQELISGWNKIAGIAVALTAPFLGAAADRMGRRKPLIAVMTITLAAATALQWWALPAEAGLPLWAIGAGVVVAGVAYTWTEVLHNSMLSTVAPPVVLSRVSGLGFAMGNASSLLMLVFVLWAWALPGVAPLPFLPDAPLFGLDPAQHEPSRIVAPFTAAWLLAFSIPFFLFAPDLVATGEKFGDALRHGVGNVVRTLGKLNHHRNVALFLLARMLYSDGKTAILVFSGVYAAGVMGWGLIEMLAFGIVISVFAVLGGVAGGWLDSWLGPKRAVALEIAVTIACLAAMVSMSADHIFFFIPVEPGARVWSGPIFQTAPELAYICVVMVVAVSITAAYASSRTLMARLTPPGMEGELFGLYALSGAATAWLGPLLVEHFTRTYQSQTAGFASILILLAIGLFVLLFVKPPASPSAAPAAPPAGAPAPR